MTPADGRLVDQGHQHLALAVQMNAVSQQIVVVELVGLDVLGVQLHLHRPERLVNNPG